MKKSQHLKHLIASIFLSFIFLFASIVANATDRYVKADGLCGGNSPCYTTIQAAIDAAAPGDVIKVYPGTYNNDEANSRNPNTGGAGGNDFNIFIDKSLTIKGVDALGNDITSYSGVLASVVGKRNLPTFGTSAIFVQAAGVTIQGLEVTTFEDLINYNGKTIETSNDNTTIKYCKIHAMDQTACVYISDYHYDNVNDISQVQTYRVEGCYIDGGGIDPSGIRIANGAGWTGPNSGRVITGNTFYNSSDAIAFVGPGAAGWELYPVGGATITSNSFALSDRRHVIAWGVYTHGAYVNAVGYGTIDWCGIMSGNTFDKGAFTWAGLTNCPTGTPRTWDAGAFYNVTGIYSTIQRYAINKAVSGDLVEVMPGTYVEQLVIDGKNLTITGAGAATTIVQAPAVLTNDPDGAKTIVLFTGAITAEISGFTIQGPVNGLNFGIYVRDGATVNIHNNTVKDIRDNPLSGAQSGYGIEIGKYNNTFPFVNQIGHATITTNTVYGYQKNGIECEGAGSSATITGNTVTGAGLFSTTAQNGIQIRRGATGSINTNTVTGNAYTGHEVNATGISVTYPGNDVIIQGNIVNHNTANIYTYEAHGVQILNNQVSDAADGRITAGITADADFEATATVGNTVTITGNSVKNNLSGGSHQGPGIFLWGVNSGTVSGNDIVGSGDDGILIGASGNITITNNLFSGNGNNTFPGEAMPPYSVIVGTDPNAAAIDFGGVIPELEVFGVQLNPLGGFSVHNNSIVGNRNGIWNYNVLSVDAECNWWGSTTGPTQASNPGGSGDIASDNVDFTPWLINGTDTDPGATGFQPLANICNGTPNDNDGDGVPNADDCNPLDPNVGLPPKLNTSINGVVVNSNNDGSDDNASFNVCNTPNNIVFNYFVDANGTTGAMVKAYQVIQNTNVSVPFCSGCSAALTLFAGATGTASLSDPNSPGTLVMKFQEFFDTNGNGQIDANECAGDVVIYTVTVNPLPAVSCPANTNTASCQTQTAVDAAYASWLTTASATNGTLSNNSTGAPDKCGGTTTVTFTATSTNGCGTKTCSASFTVTSATAVVLNCPATTTVASCQTQSAVDAEYASWLATVSTSGGCNTSLTNNSTGAPLACGGTKTVTFTVTSSCELAVTCSASFTVTSATAVVLNCPATTTVASGQTQSAVDAEYAAWLATVSTSGGCNASLTNNSTGAPSATGGTKTVTFIVTSSCEGNKTCSATFTVTTAPAVVLTCPTNTTVAPCQTQAAVNAEYTAWLATASTSGGCNRSLTNNSTGAPLACGGTKTVTFTVTSSCGPNVTCSAPFTVTSAMPVVLTCPTNKTVASCQTQAAVNAAYATWLATASASGGCNRSLTNNSTGAPNACGGTKTVTFTATSSCPTNKTCSASFTVTPDLTKPVISHCPSNITSCNSNVSWTVPTASDNCKLQSFTSNHNCGETFPTGTTTVSYTAKDACGNTSTCSFTVTINPAPKAGTISGLSTVCVGSTITLTISGNSAIGGWSSSNTSIATVTSGGVVKGIYAGPVTIKYTVTNSCGSAVATKSITVGSGTPVIKCPFVSSCTKNAGASCKYTVSGNEFNATATCACGTPTLSYTLSGATSGTGTSLSGVQLNKGLTTVTWKATNGSQSCTCSFTVNVTDNQKPSITCKAGTTKKIANSASCYTVSGSEFNATASDNCGTPSLIYCLSGATVSAYSSTNKSLAGKNLNVGTTTITWKATDASDNVSTCTTIVTVSRTNNLTQDNIVSGLRYDNRVAAPNPAPFTVRVIPNPTSNYFTLQLKSESYGKFKITVIDVTGRLIEQRPDVPANSTLQLGNKYRPGVYIAEILQDKNKVVLRLIKEGK